MVVLINTKSCIITLICGLTILGSRVECQLESWASESSLEFGHKWLASPKTFIGMVLPNMYPIRIKDVVKLTKE